MGAHGKMVEIFGDFTRSVGNDGTVLTAEEQLQMTPIRSNLRFKPVQKPVMSGRVPPHDFRLGLKLGCFLRISTNFAIFFQKFLQNFSNFSRKIYGEFSLFCFAFFEFK